MGGWRGQSAEGTGRLRRGHGSPDGAWDTGWATGKSPLEAQPEENPKCTCLCSLSFPSGQAALTPVTQQRCPCPVGLLCSRSSGATGSGSAFRDVPAAPQLACHWRALVPTGTITRSHDGLCCVHGGRGPGSSGGPKGSPVKGHGCSHAHRAFWWPLAEGFVLSESLDTVDECSLWRPSALSSSSRTADVNFLTRQSVVPTANSRLYVSTR